LKQAKDESVLEISMVTSERERLKSELSSVKAELNFVHQQLTERTTALSDTKHELTLLKQTNEDLVAQSVRFAVLEAARGPTWTRYSDRRLKLRPPGVLGVLEVED
jgi:nitrate/nitrite-specific signal transduction histidine kinase